MKKTPFEFETELRQSASRYRVEPSPFRASRIAEQAMAEGRAPTPRGKPRLFRGLLQAAAVVGVLVVIGLSFNVFQDSATVQETAREEIMIPSNELLVDLENDIQQALNFLVEHFTLVPPQES